jgi:glycosyltransferase involved in cell wall biosynthesis
MRKVTIVVPCYNEEARLDVGAFLDYRPARHDVRFLFVNDGSKDRTLEILNDLASRDGSRYGVLDLPQNGGKAEAVRAGMLRAHDEGAEYFGFWDADLATPLDAIEGFCHVLDARPEIELVFGARVRLMGRTIERKAIRHYIGRLFATAVAVAFRVRAYDTQCGAKLFRSTPLLRTIFEQPFMTRWIFDVEILTRYCLAAPVAPREAIYELPLQAWYEIGGSKLRGKELVRVASDFLRLWAHSPHAWPRRPRTLPAPATPATSSPGEGPHFGRTPRERQRSTTNP